jgi:hypothetical protein
MADPETIRELMKVVMESLKKVAAEHPDEFVGTVDVMKKAHPEWFDISEIEPENKV